MRKSGRDACYFRFFFRNTAAEATGIETAAIAAAAIRAIGEAGVGSTSASDGGGVGVAALLC